MQDSGHIPVWADQRVQRTNARGRHILEAPVKLDPAAQVGVDLVAHRQAGHRHARLRRLLDDPRLERLERLAVEAMRRCLGCCRSASRPSR